MKINENVGEIRNVNTNFVLRKVQFGIFFNFSMKSLKIFKYLIINRNVEFSVTMNAVSCVNGIVHKNP